MQQWSGLGFSLAKLHRQNHELTDGIRQALASAG
jgi:hypothetical protein